MSGWLVFNFVVSVLVILSASVYVVEVIRNRKSHVKCTSRDRSYFFVKLGYIISFAIYGYGVYRAIIGDPINRIAQVESVSLILVTVLFANISSLLRNNIIRLYKIKETDGCN